MPEYQTMIGKKLRTLFVAGLLPIRMIGGAEESIL